MTKLLVWLNLLHESVLVGKITAKEPSHFFSIIHSHYVNIDNRAIFQNGASSLVPIVQPRLLCIFISLSTIEISGPLTGQTHQRLAPPNHFEPTEYSYIDHMETAGCVNTETVEGQGLPNLLAQLPIEMTIEIMKFVCRNSLLHDWVTTIIFFDKFLTTFI